MALLVRPEPFSTQDFDRLFNTLLEPFERGRVQRWSPPMDLVEAEDSFILKADLPGMSEDDVAIEVHDGTLRLSGERHAEHEQSEKGWYRVERSFGKFSRSMTLPDGVDPDKIQAKFDRGVLEVRIPKPEERKPRRISIANDPGKPETLEGAASDR
ncbi:MAG TPA: Hsp20/alpha crystallin family protein [Thermoleophilaceae bacterium]